MKAATILSIPCLVLAMSASIPPASADSAEATCQIRKDGETKEGASGPCTFSQRQGYIDIDLKNGNTISLSPGDKANHYKDQKGRRSCGPCTRTAPTSTGGRARSSS